MARREENASSDTQVQESVRNVLNLDRNWSIYALADLAPPHAQYADWITDNDHNGAPGLILVYSGFSPPILFAMGSITTKLIQKLPSAQQVFSLSVPDHCVPLLSQNFEITQIDPMWRMTVEQPSFIPGPEVPASYQLCSLVNEHLQDIQALFSDGIEYGESPDAFSPAMLNEGYFFGVRDKAGTLVSCSGTHCVSSEEGVAAIGNVYTMRAQRGLGLGRITMSAVIGKLFARGIDLVGLNVKQSNHAAIRSYEHLGFRKHTSFCEGQIARKRPPD